MRIFFLFIAAGTCFLFFLAAKKMLRIRRRRQLSAAPFPPEWDAILEKNISIYRRLPDNLREQLRRDIRIFLDEKRFEGLGGLEMTDEIRVTIAAGACLLLLNRENRNYPGLISILVYPAAYVAEETAHIGGGVYAEGPVVRLGESWKHGSVVLAWDNVKQSALNPGDGYNVVLHEFAHQLDQEDGLADGAPVLEEQSGYAVWAQIMSEEYERLQEVSEHNGESVMDEYGATDPAEFFAVATETFFEKPLQLKKKAPYLYAELKEFYKVDPAEWFNETP